MATKAATRSSSKPSRPTPQVKSKPKSRTKRRLRTAENQSSSTTPKVTAKPAPAERSLSVGGASRLPAKEDSRTLPDLSWGGEAPNSADAGKKLREESELPAEPIPGPPRRPQIGEHDRNRASQILGQYEAKHDAWEGKYGEGYSAIQEELKKLPPRPKAPQYDIYNRGQSEAERAQHEQRLQAWQAQYGERYRELNSLIK